MKKAKLEVRDEVREGDGGTRVCAESRFQEDDLEGECDECHKPVFYRPEPPFLIKKLCMSCGAKLIASQEEPTIMCTKKTMDSVEQYLKDERCKPGQNTATPQKRTKSRR